MLIAGCHILLDHVARTILSNHELRYGLPRAVMGPPVANVQQVVLVWAQLSFGVDTVGCARIVHLAAAAADERVEVGRLDLAELEKLKRLGQRHRSRQSKPRDLGHLGV